MKTKVIAAALISPQWQ